MSARLPRIDPPSPGEAGLLVQGGLVACKVLVDTDVHEGVSAPGHHGQVPLSRPKPRGSQRRLLAGRLIQAHNEHEHDKAKWDHGHGPPEPPHAPVEVGLLHGLLLRRDGPNEDAQHGPSHDVSKGGRPICSFQVALLPARPTFSLMYTKGGSAPGHHSQAPLSRHKPRGSQRRLLAGRLIQAQPEHERDMAERDHGQGPPEPPQAPLEVALLHGILRGAAGRDRDSRCW